MKLSQLISQLERGNLDPDLDIVIVTKLPYTTIGAVPSTPVKNISTGFDWEHGKLLIWPEENLTPSDTDFEKKFRDMQDKYGWADYENRNLKAEIKKLKKKANLPE
jgi:hypothetical protein